MPYPTWLWGGLLALAWGLPGLIGHDPWKPEEAVAFGVIHGILQGGSWIDLQLAGEPLPGTAPLFYWICALSAKLFGPWLPAHDAARLGAGMLAAGCVGFLVTAARAFCGTGAGTAAFLLTLGTIGFIPEAHQMVPGLAMLLGYCVALHGLARWDTSPRAGGRWLGFGMGIVYLGEGLTHTLVLGASALLLPFLFPAWRRQDWGSGLLTAFAVAAPFVLSWPVVLWVWSPEQLPAWFSVLTHLREMHISQILADAWSYLSVLVWQGAPNWPLALWALWSARRRFGEERALHAPLLLLATAFLVLVHDAATTEGHRLILMPSLILLAAHGVGTLRRGAAHALMWFSIMFFFLFGLTGWYYWVGFDLGFPERLVRHVTRMQPGYVVSEFGLRLSIALLLSAGWLTVMLRMRRSPTRPLLAWTAGTTLIWGLLMTLYINYLDTGRSYRGVARQLSAALPAGHGCITGLAIGPSQRAMFHYFGGITTRPAAGADHDCDLLLVQSTRDAPHEPGPDWTALYAGTRLGDKREWYQLFAKVP